MISSWRTLFLMDDFEQQFQTQQAWHATQDFLTSVTAHATRPAITIADTTLSYAALHTRVQTLAAAIAEQETAATTPVTAIYASRDIDTYAAVLAALSRGHAYVPLNPKFPPERNRYILERSGATHLLHCAESGPAVAEILAVPSTTGDAPLPRQINTTQLQESRQPPARLHDNPYAYILFTSGSTGQPKGVALRHSNLSAYLDATFAVADYRADDRLSQNFDLTFDLSVHDMFVCWRAGAHLIVPTAHDLEAPADYLHRHDITCWFSVPSLAQKMRLQGALAPGSLSHLRLSLFCGEALPVDLAQDWARATTQRVENWYGPTEATIACTRYVLPSNPDAITGRFDLVPIGSALPGMSTLVLQEDGTPAGPGDSGELLMCGPQVADGYLEDAEKTAAAFVIPQGQELRHYRTGDRVEVTQDGVLNFIDRIDNQIKIRGYRVELGEIEATLREAATGCNAVVVPLPLKSANPTSLVAAVEGYDGPGRRIREAIAGKLPDYMSPNRVLVMQQFPKNASGKVDRGEIGKRVVKRLEKQNTAAGPKKLTRYDRLIQFAQEVNPALARSELEQAENLMDAGLDSMGFVDFTVRLEKQFNLELTQESAAELSRMSLWQMVDFLRRALAPQGKDRFQPPAANSLKTPELKRNLHYRAMRALDMLDKFPGFVSETQKPLLLCIGSSGFMRGICTETIETEAQALGQDLRAANLGMAMLSVAGIAEVCDYVRETLQAQGRRLSHAVIEMEIMQLSIMPPAGDIEILQDFKAGAFKGIERKYYDADTIWDSDSGGTIARSDKPSSQAAPQANWERKRAQEICRAFEGQLKMDDKAVAAWIKGVQSLQQVSDRVTAVIHPIQHPEGTAGLKQARQGSNHFSGLIDQARQETGIEIMLDTDFTLRSEDFKNISHVNDHNGRQSFSAQIARHFLR